MKVLLYDDERDPLTAAILQSDRLREEYSPLSFKELLEEFTLIQDESAAVRSFILKSSNRCIDSREVSLLVNRVKNRNMREFVLKTGDISNYKLVYGILAQAFSKYRATTSPISSLSFGMDTPPLIEQWRLVSYLKIPIPEYFYGLAADMLFPDVDVVVVSPDDTLATIQERPEPDPSEKTADALRFKKQHGTRVSVLVANDQCHSLSDELLHSDRQQSIYDMARLIAKTFRQRFVEIVFSLEADRALFLFATSDFQLVQDRPWLMDLFQKNLEKTGATHAL